MATVAVSVVGGFSPGGVVSSPKFPPPGTWNYVPRFDMSSLPVRRWLRTKAPRTQTYYLFNMQKFLTWAEKQRELGFNTPETFLQWAEAQQKSLFVQDAIDGFVETQKPSQRVVCVATLRKFLEANGYEKRLPTSQQTSSLKQFHRGYKRDEIQRLLGFLDDDFQKLYVLMAKDSGLRACDTLSIEYHHLKPDLEAVDKEGKPLDVCHIYFEPRYFDPQRRKRAGITFLGPNSVRLLREMLRDQRISRNPDARIFPWAYTTITDILRLARKKAGLDPRIQPSHGFRKFFENGLKKLDPPLDDDKKNQLEGHSLGVRWHYTDQDVEELRKLYERAYRFLDLSEEAVVDERVKELQEKVAAQEKQLTRLQELEREQELMRQRMDRAEFLGSFQVQPEKQRTYREPGVDDK